MRTVNLFLMTLVLCAEAFGQNYSPSIVPGPTWETTVQMQDHSQSTVQRSLFEGSSAGFARGELPAYEIPGLPQPRPLGDVAREYRKEHAKAKKAVIVWEP
jgi:hypothetical protein